MQTFHVNFEVVEVGLYINSDTPYIGASPDGIVKCDCHEPRALEIKCPFAYANGIINWETDKKFVLDKDGNIKEKHQYYIQIQVQMLLTGYNSCDLIIYSPKSNGSTSKIVNVPRNEETIQQFLQKAKRVFFDKILPEIVSRKNDPALENERTQYCICRRPSFGLMVACDGRNCAWKWFHYSCVGLVRAPKGNWHCDSCKPIKKHKRKLNK